MVDRRRDLDPEDDGRTIADMNVEGMPWYLPGQKENASGDGEDHYQMTPREQRLYTLAAARAALLIVVVDLISGPETMLVVDPVMADNGSYYSNMGDDMCTAFRHLIRRADVITPNITEAALLAGTDYTPDGHDEEYLSRMFHMLSELGPRMIAITGIRVEGMIGNVAYDAGTGESFRALRPMHDGLFYGTGDLFASSLAALLVRGASLCSALEIATALTDDSIALSLQLDTPRRFGVNFESALPAYIDRVRNLFLSDPSLNLSD